MASRKSSGNARSSDTRRSTTGTVAAILGIVVAAAAAFAGNRLLRARAEPGSAEHPAPDLTKDGPRPGPEHRAPDAFRPDPTAPVPASERAGLAPATGPSPTLVADRGGLRSEPAASA